MSNDTAEPDATPKASAFAAVLSVTSMGALVHRIECRGDHGPVVLALDPALPRDAVFAPALEPLLALALETLDRADGGEVHLMDLAAAGAHCRVEGLHLTPSGPHSERTFRLAFETVRGPSITLLKPQMLAPFPSIDTRMTDAMDLAFRLLYMPLREFDAAIETALQAGDGNTLNALHGTILDFKTQIETVNFGFERILDEQAVGEEWSGLPRLPQD